MSFPHRRKNYNLKEMTIIGKWGVVPALVSEFGPRRTMASHLVTRRTRSYNDENEINLVAVRNPLKGGAMDSGRLQHNKS
jgi:hypothetical protein